MIVWVNEIQRPLFSRALPVARFGFEDAKKHTIHRHFDHIAFSFLFGERIHVTIEDQNRTYEIREPACVLALPGDVRKMIPRLPVNEFFMVYKADFLNSFYPDEREIPGPYAKYVPLSATPFVPDIVSLIRAMLAGQPTPHLCAELDLLAETIMLATFRQAGQGGDAEENMVERIRAYINLHYHETIDWDRAAEDLRISYSSMRRLWKQKYAQSLYSLVMELRNREACELLKDKSLSVSEIAELTGYPDIRYFSRFFKRVNHCSPREYRARLFDV